MSSEEDADENDPACFTIKKPTVYRNMTANIKKTIYKAEVLLV